MNTEYSLYGWRCTKCSIEICLHLLALVFFSLVIPRKSIRTRFTHIFKAIYVSKKKFIKQQGASNLVLSANIIFLLQQRGGRPKLTYKLPISGGCSWLREDKQTAILAFNFSTLLEVTEGRCRRGARVCMKARGL